jgi:hypothetical protein
MTLALQVLLQARPKCLKANGRFGRMQLILIAAYQLFKISKLRFHGPAQRHRANYLLQAV